MTYNVFGGTLNLTLLNLYIIYINKNLHQSLNENSHQLYDLATNTTISGAYMSNILKR